MSATTTSSPVSTRPSFIHPAPTTSSNHYTFPPTQYPIPNTQSSSTSLKMAPQPRTFSEELSFSPLSKTTADLPLRNWTENQPTSKPPQEPKLINPSQPVSVTRMTQIANDACSSTLEGAVAYDHAKTGDWNSNIIVCVPLLLPALLYPTGIVCCDR